MFYPLQPAVFSSWVDHSNSCNNDRVKPNNKPAWHVLEFFNVDLVTLIESAIGKFWLIANKHNFMFVVIMRDNECTKN